MSGVIVGVVFAVDQALEQNLLQPVEHAEGYENQCHDGEFKAQDNREERTRRGDRTHVAIGELAELFSRLRVRKLRKVDRLDEIQSAANDVGGQGPCGDEQSAPVHGVVGHRLDHVLFVFVEMRVGQELVSKHGKAFSIMGDGCGKQAHDQGPRQERDHRQNDWQTRYFVHGSDTYLCRRLWRLRRDMPLRESEYL